MRGVLEGFARWERADGTLTEVLGTDCGCHSFQCLGFPCRWPKIDVQVLKRLHSEITGPLVSSLDQAVALYHKESEYMLSQTQNLLQRISERKFSRDGSRRTGPADIEGHPSSRLVQIGSGCSSICCKWFSTDMQQTDSRSLQFGVQSRTRL